MRYTVNGVLADIQVNRRKVCWLKNVKFFSVKNNGEIRETIAMFQQLSPSVLIFFILSIL